MKISVISLLVLASSTYAGSHQAWHQVDQLIPGYQKKLDRFNEKLDCRLDLPAKLLVPESGRYYLYLDKNALGGVAYVDYSADCQGAHYCNAGSLAVERLVHASNSTFVYQAPSVGADYHRAQLTWSRNYCQFTLSWDTSKKNLLNMASSISKP